VRGFRFVGGGLHGDVIACQLSVVVLFATETSPRAFKESKTLPVLSHATYSQASWRPSSGMKATAESMKRTPVMPSWSSRDDGKDQYLRVKFHAMMSHKEFSNSAQELILILGADSFDSFTF